MCFVFVGVDMFLYPGGDLNPNAHQHMGTHVTLGTKIEVQMGKKAYKLSKNDQISMIFMFRG